MQTGSGINSGVEGVLGANGSWGEISVAIEASQRSIGGGVNSIKNKGHGEQVGVGNAQQRAKSDSEDPFGQHIKAMLRIERKTIADKGLRQLRFKYLSLLA